MPAKKTSFATDEFPQDDGLTGVGKISKTVPQKKEAVINVVDKHKIGFFSAPAFVQKPTIRFETQAVNEEIILLLRKHPVTNIVWIITVIIMLLAPFILFPYLSWSGLIQDLPTRFGIVGTILWFLITFAFAFESFVSWYFNAYLITNERALDVDFLNLLYKRVTEARLDKIQDVTYTQSGMAQSVFNYGDVLIQTAGEQENLDFESVPNPAHVAETISGLLNK